MPLKIQLSSQKSTNSEILAGVDWLNEDEVISVDDHRILRWSCLSAAEGKLEAISLPNYTTNNNEPIFPTSIQLIRRSAATVDSVRSQNSTKISIQKPRSTINSPNNAYNNELILMTASDGKIHLINLSGKFEKSIEAHKGAAILARWSNAEPGGAGGFASCGEDGCVKIWSRNGMLRSVLCKISKPIYALDWNGDSSKLAYCASEDCFIKSMTTQTSPTKWHAHSGLVLCLSWSAINDQIVTGGEDCRYRLWDGQGRPLWSSVAHGFPITSIAWSLNGKMFAVGAFNLLRLCDKSGWSHSMERPNSGSIYCLSWSSDSTQLVGGCANGQLLHAHTFEKRLIWEHFEAVQTHNKTINIRNFSSDVAREMLEIRDRIIRLELGFNFLVVATIKQCYIFSAKNWNTPIVTNLKETNGAVTLIKLCEKCFLLVDSISVQIWNYEGRILSTIRLPPSSSTFGEPFNEQTAAISNDLVVLRDRAQHSVMHLFDPQSGRTTGDGQIMHTAKIVELCVNQCGPISDRRVAFVDTNGDCFLALVNRFGASQRSIKIGSLISCLLPSNCTNMLAAFQDTHRLILWTWPTVAFVDRDLLQPTQLELANSGGELDKSSIIIGFIGNTITVRRSDGCLVAHYVPPFIAGLIRCVLQSHWDQAIRICRSIKEEFLWATLAGMAVAEKQFSIAEICYGQLHEAEKVLFLSSLCGQQNAQIHSAQIAQFGGQIRECESALINEGRYFRAIMLNVGAFRFEKALELAIKSGTHLDTVLGYRQRYVELLGRKENDPKFLKYLSQVEIDWPHIFEKIHEDEQKDQHHQWGNTVGGGLNIPN